MKKVLLHICCAGCATASVSRLKEQGYYIKGFFYNPNIHPEDEYIRRRQDLEKISDKYSIDIEEGAYDTQNWFNSVKGFESEPEGGKRCGICFRLRLYRTYKKMLDGDYDFFSTTLTISPHKNSKLINRLGREIGGDRFLERDFKKKDGFKQSVLVSRKLGLYRQNYCGCVYSRR